MRGALVAAQRAHAQPALRLRPHPWDAADPTASHLEGQPYAEAGAAWPECGFCGAPLWFMAQVRMADLEEVSRLRDLVQFFVCGHCFDGMDQDQGSWRVRGWPDPAPDRHVPLPHPEGDAGVGRGLTAERVVSFPHPEDVAALGLDPGEARTDEVPPERAVPGCQVGGWPVWIHDPEQVACGRCGEPMRLLLQLGPGEDGSGQDYIDEGAAYLFVCERHPDRLGVAVQSH